MEATRTDLCDQIFYSKYLFTNTASKMDYLAGIGTLRFSKENWTVQLTQLS